MNPHTQPLTPYEQRLRDEVIYLHSLWHQGPPTQNPHRLNPNYNNNPSRNLLYVSNPTTFKQTNRKNEPRYHKKAKKKNNNDLFGSRSDAQPDPGPEWPLNPPQPSSPPFSSGWPAFKSSPSSLTLPLPDSNQLGKITQHRVVKCCTEFFTKTVDLDSDEDGEFDEGDGDGDEEYWVHDNDVEESEEFKFLLGLFVDNQELRELYEKNQDSGDFYCLVCGGIGVKIAKTFSGCVGLVQHAIAISKTKRKRAHRAFGQVICRVLGWDVSRLPMIVFKGEPLSRSLLNSGQAQLNAGAGTGAGNNGESVEKVVYDLHAKEGEMAVCKNCSKADDGNKLVEDLDNVVCSMEASKDRHANYKGEPKKNADYGYQDSNFPKNNAESAYCINSKSATREDAGVHQKNGIPMICANTLCKDNANEHVNDLDKEYIGANKAGAVDSEEDHTTN